MEANGQAGPAGSRLWEAGSDANGPNTLPEGSYATDVFFLGPAQEGWRQSGRQEAVGTPWVWEEFFGRRRFFCH